MEIFVLSFIFAALAVPCVAVIILFYRISTPEDEFSQIRGKLDYTRAVLDATSTRATNALLHAHVHDDLWPPDISKDMPIPLNGEKP